MSYKNFPQNGPKISTRKKLYLCICKKRDVCFLWGEGGRVGGRGERGAVTAAMAGERKGEEVGSRGEGRGLGWDFGVKVEARDRIARGKVGAAFERAMRNVPGTWATRDPPPGVVPPRWSEQSLVVARISARITKSKSWGQKRQLLYCGPPYLLMTSSQYVGVPCTSQCWALRDILNWQLGRPSRALKTNRDVPGGYGRSLPNPEAGSRILGWRSGLEVGFGTKV